MTDISQSRLETLGFRFLGGPGSDEYSLDRQDIVADQEGEIVYTPADLFCFSEFSAAMQSLLDGKGSGFNCRGDGYQFEIKGDRIRYKPVYGQIVSEARQRDGYREAVRQTLREPDAGKRVSWLASIASSMVLSDSEEFSRGAAARMLRELGPMNDERKMASSIIDACDVISRDRHPSGYAASLYASMVPLARSIEDSAAHASALSRIAMGIAVNTSPRTVVMSFNSEEAVNAGSLFREAIDEAGMVQERPTQQSVRAQIASYMSRAGMKYEAYDEFSDILDEIETVAFFDTLSARRDDDEDDEAGEFFQALGDIASWVRESKLGDMTSELLQRSAELSAGINNDWSIYCFLPSLTD